MSAQHYYSKVFPAELVVDLLCRRTSRAFTHREFSLVWNDSTQRYNSYTDAQELRKDLARRQPQGVSAGAVYSIEAPLRFTVGLEQMLVVERELLFDIDLTDYDDVRICECPQRTAGMRCCRSCWTLVVAGMLVLRYLLRHKFGLFHFLFVFSGSKGAHCWVLDRRSLVYNDKARKGVAAYLWPFAGRTGTPSACAALLPSSCPVLDACYRQVMLPFFEQHILGRVLNFNKPEHQAAADECAKHAGYDGALFASILSGPSREMWTGVRAKLGDGDLWQRVERAVVFRYCFPRIDAAVTELSSHTLRCPFSINPKTDCMVLPFDLESALDFNVHEPASLNNFGEGLSAAKTVAQRALLPPWKRVWICRECADKRQPLADTSIIYTSFEMLQEHCREQHHPSPDSLQNTLGSFADNPRRRRELYLQYLKQRN